MSKAYNVDDDDLVVVDDECGQEMRESLKRLEEVQLMYKSAQNALMQSNALLQEKIECALQLALRGLPADTESNIHELRKMMSESLSDSSAAILRNHIQSLSARLIAVNADYENVSEELKNLKLNDKPETLPTFLPKLDRLMGILRELDGLLPGGSEYDTSLNSSSDSDTDLWTSVFPKQRSVDDDIENLCVLAEGVKVRMKMALEAKAKVEEFNNPPSTNFQVSSCSMFKKSEEPVFASSSIQQSPKQQSQPEQQFALEISIASVLREYVAVAQQKELQNIRKDQSGLTNSTLEQQTVPKEEGAFAKEIDFSKPATVLPEASGVPPPSCSNDARVDVITPPVCFPSVPFTPQSYAPYPNPNDLIQVPAVCPFLNYHTSSVRRDREPQYTGRLSCVVNDRSMFPFGQVPRRVAPTEPPQVSRVCPPFQAQRNMNGPSFTTEQENPLCPVCHRVFYNRIMLEMHLDKCLS